MRKHLVPLLAASVLTLTAGRVARAEPSALAPIPEAEAKSTHGPYQSGACETCHQRHDALDPGPAVKVSNDLCFDCHDEFRGKAPVRMDKAVHPKIASNCTKCHNPHNARKTKLRM
jgi:predicted CXXCH cytochrome family protein